MYKNFCLAVAALLVCLSCCTSTDGDGNGYDQTTVLGTLNLFLEVWNDGDVSAYESLLDEDDFTFYFDPADVGGDIPVSWGFEEEITAFTNLFDVVGPENVDVELDFSDVTEPKEGTDTYLIEEIPYFVQVQVDDMTFPAEADLDMQFAKIDGEWLITDWWDRFSWRLLCGVECSWGGIKAYFNY
ncbi:hypothetical protein KAU45_07330 [bacterium]|nr:hypothetical protein [bacterium]